MKLVCIECDESFESAIARGYCDGCVDRFREQRKHVHQRQHPAPNVLADGKFAKGSPQSVEDPINGKQICGLCGSDELDPGYGLGSYTFCMGCNNFLDFHEDLS